jgi:uncharacterized protein YdaU (DUF1376 family)
MNYFDLHIGDYQRKTAHLTLAQHGAYSLMLQAFYQSEKPLPADPRVLYRLLRAETGAERKAIDTVAAEFWRNDGTGLTNKKAAEVLAEYKRWVEKQKANGKLGGRPKVTEGLTQTKANGGDSHLNLPLKPPTSHLHSDSEGGPNGHAPQSDLKIAFPEPEKTDAPETPPAAVTEAKEQALANIRKRIAPYRPKAEAAHE